MASETKTTAQHSIGTVKAEGETQLTLPASPDFIPNHKNHGDGLDLLAATADSSVKAAFLDPQYRGVLDKLNYGDEGHGRGQARAALPQMGDEQIARFVNEIARVLVPSGHLFLWVDKYSLFESVTSWIESTALSIVDLVTWDKGRIGLGWRTRHQSEFLVVLQKSPKRAKGVWSDRSMPDVWGEKVQKKHVHSKPVELHRRRRLLGNGSLRRM